MATKINSKYAYNLTKQEFENCLKLTLGPNGRMQPKLIYYAARKQKLPADNARAFMIKLEDRVIAWSLVFPMYSIQDKSSKNAYFYVDYAYRREGYASRLMNAIKKYYPENPIYVDPWNTPSTKFFNTQFNDQVRKNPWI